MNAEPKDNILPTFASRMGYVLLSILCLSLSIHVLLIAAWAWSGVESTIRERARDIVVRAVLKTGTTDRQARTMAGRMQEKTPGIEVNVIGRIEARTMLSVQEPWLTKLPDVEVGELPGILEVRHPAVSGSQDKLKKFAEDLGQLPEVDFVMFNTTGYEGFRKFVDAVRGYTRLIGSAVGLSALAFYLLLNLGMSRLKGRHSLAAGIAYGCGIFVPSYVLAWLLFGLTRAIADGKLPPIPRPGFGATVPLTLVILAIVVLLELKNVQPKPRPKQPPLPQ